MATVAAMSEEARFHHQVFGLKLRIWVIAGVVLLVGLAVGAVLWAIVSGRDVVAIVGDVLTFMTLLAALVALKYAAESAQAALGTVEPMKAMAANLTTAAAALEDMQSSLITTAGTMQANLILAERGRQEDRLVHRLEQYGRVVAAITTMRRAWLTQSVPEREQWTRDGQVMLRAAVAPLPRNELPECRTLSTDTVVSGLTMGGWDKAVIEIDKAVSDTLEKLNDLLKSAAL